MTWRSFLFRPFILLNLSFSIGFKFLLDSHQSAQHCRIWIKVVDYLILYYRRQWSKLKNCIYIYMLEYILVKAIKAHFKIGISVLSHIANPECYPNTIVANILKYRILIFSLHIWLISVLFCSMPDQKYTSLAWPHMQFLSTQSLQLIQVCPN